MRSTWLRLLAVLLAFGLLASACGDDDDTTSDDTPTDTTDGDDTDSGDTPTDTTDGGDDTDTPVVSGCEATVPGSQINYGVYAPGRSLDPIAASGALVGGTELAAIYDVLMRFNPDTGEFDPQLAVGMTSNDDYTVWTLELRPDITFDDGTPLDAELVVANLARYLPEDGTRILNTSPAFVQLIESSTVVDPLTVEFTLVQPWASFPYLFNDEPGMIVNINAIGDDPEAFGAQPPAAAGVGPYIVESVTSGEEVVMKARENYWGGPVCVETLRFDLAASSAIIGNPAAYEAFQNGDLDLAFLRNETTIAEVIDNGETVSIAPQDAGVVLIFNLREGAPLNDDALREGVALAIDPAQINERAYNGDLLAEKSLVTSISPYYSDAVEEMATDPTRAAELIAESGFTGTIDLLCASGPEATETALTVEAQLEAAGVDVAVQNLPTTDQIGLLATGDYDIGCWGHNSGPDTAVPAYLRNLTSASPSNRQGLADPVMDDLIADALAAPAAELPAALAAISNRYIENFSGVPVGAVREGVVIAEGLEGVKQTGSTIYLFDDAYWTE